ncbi:tetratricopeptide repeat-containing sulfotransferase family protein [Caulobacter sp. NIBR1757]|uniref:tetratricopeptide repeat-containing sulfotransferase family protein n=1 Tax=Caulobacter sp. NIBR1757 TaxID=3016000 RepID=UPI0022F12DA6|nr:tetratricopeptide repeat-containing sulfotransferase family protein [Caulobacter sp. NIBR1757]WGM37618.1 Beta-barrel assembly-enhancing protease [Caulobacter sp. NIBR1757]
MTDDTATTGTLATALTHGRRLLGQDPALAEAQAREILTALPGQPEAILLLAAALRRQGRAEAGLVLLEAVIRALPDWPLVHLEAGLAFADLGIGRAAIAALSKAVTLDGRLSMAWDALTDQLQLAGDEAGAARARAEQIKASVSDPELMQAATALIANDLPVAERILKPYLNRHPTHVAAIRMLAEVAARLGRNEDAQALLERCLDLAPGFAEARYNHATVLYRLTRAQEALAELEPLMASNPRHAGYRNLKAAVLGRLGDYDGAIALYEGVLAEHPNQPKGWMSLGHSYKTVGRQADSVAAYRKTLDLAPQFGEAWWSLANLKTVKFSDEDVAAMRAQLARADIADEDRFHLHYALGKALEDAGEPAAAFESYAAGAALRRAGIDYEAEHTTAHARRSMAVFTPAFFAERRGWGCPAPDPIFIVGLPRAGSTLIEQILASHSLVEGTMELPDIIAMARRLGGRHRRESDGSYPEMLTGIDAAEARALGEEYLERTRVQRKTGRPFFIDKMPNNFAHVGLIRLILPNAKIIDARRHPLGCCFSAFKQHFARGQGFSYDLTDLGRYYADYVALMAHFDAVQPGAVHRTIYERMIADPEGEVRALLAYCGLDFEPGVMKFHENDRAVRTASSEQVRRPIFTEGLDQWRAYEPWLGPLKTALGPVLETWDQG